MIISYNCYLLLKIIAVAMITLTIAAAVITVYHYYNCNVCYYNCDTYSSIIYYNYNHYRYYNSN